MTTSGASLPPASSNILVRISLPTLPPPTITSAPLSGPFTMGSAERARKAGSAGRAGRENTARTNSAFRILFVMLSSCPSCPSCPSRLRPRACPLNKASDICFQLLVLGRADINHVTGFVVGERHTIGERRVVAEVREIVFRSAHYRRHVVVPDVHEDLQVRVVRHR